MHKFRLYSSTTHNAIPKVSSDILIYMLSVPWYQDTKKDQTFGECYWCVSKTFPKIWCKTTEPKKVMRVQSRWDGNSAGEFGPCIVCTHELTGRSKNYDPGRVAKELRHDFG